MVIVTQKLRKVQKSQKKNYMGTADGYPKVILIDPCVTPTKIVFHPDLGVGDNLEQTELWNQLGGDTPSSAALVRSSRGGFIKSWKTASYLTAVCCRGSALENI